MSSNDFWSDVLEDTASDLLSALIKTGIKTGSRAGLGLLRAAVQDRDAPAPAAPRTYELRQTRSEIEDPFAAPAACADEFMRCLHRGDHEQACNGCEPGLFEDAERRAALLATLSAAKPSRWRTRYYHHPDDWHTPAPLPWVGIDHDVVFRLDSGARTLTLIVWIVPIDDGWAVWGVEWGPMRAE